MAPRNVLLKEILHIICTSKSTLCFDFDVRQEVSSGYKPKTQNTGTRILFALIQLFV